MSSSPTTPTAIRVFDYAGHAITTIDGEGALGDMVVVGGTLYVAQRTVGAIDRIDTATLDRDEPARHGRVESQDARRVGAPALGGHRPVHRQLGWSSSLSIDLITGIKSAFPAASSYCPFITPDPAEPNIILTTDYGLEPSSVVKLDVSSGSPVQLAQRVRERHPERGPAGDRPRRPALVLGFRVALRDRQVEPCRPERGGLQLPDQPVPDHGHRHRRERWLPRRWDERDLRP